MDSAGSTLQHNLLSQTELCSSWSVINNLKIICQVWSCLSFPLPHHISWALLSPSPLPFLIFPSPSLFPFLPLLQAFSPSLLSPLSLPLTSFLLLSFHLSFPHPPFLGSPSCTSPITTTIGIRGWNCVGKRKHGRTQHRGSVVSMRRPV